MQQKLPYLFAAFKEYASDLKVNSLVVMDDDTGFDGAVNRGPSSFVTFLKFFEEALGIGVKDFLSGQEGKTRKGEIR